MVFQLAASCFAAPSGAKVANVALRAPLVEKPIYVGDDGIESEIARFRAPRLRRLRRPWLADP
jgi:hypothetical protein